MSLAFLLCVEAGNLENQASLLVRSVRRYGGRYANCPILAFQPRRGPALAPATLELFRALDVEHRSEIINTEFVDYPLANKVLVAAAAERICTEDVIVFVDSDTIMLNEPSELDLAPGVDVAVRPVDRKGQGSTGWSDPNDAYWVRMYELCGAALGPNVTTTVDGVQIRAYWNTGLVAARRQCGLFSRWLRYFRTLSDAGHVPANSFFLEQMSFAPAAALLGERVSVLERPYNFPLPWRHRLSEPWRHAQLDELVHVHYHQWFNRPDYLSSLQPPLDLSAERARWLEELLPFHPTIDDPLGERGRRLPPRLRRLRSSVTSWIR